MSTQKITQEAIDRLAGETVSTHADGGNRVISHMESGIFGEASPGASQPQATPATSGREAISVQTPAFQTLTKTETSHMPKNLDLILDVPLEFSVVLGESKKTIKDILALGTGSVVELNKMTEEPLSIYVNGKRIAEGEVVVINENFGIRITNILSQEQRLKNL
ncbi:flagellar motor switch flin/type iii secretion hrcqb [Trichococcus palustris]|uniref:Flagellar motor switch flin/type iii secretion hrcqb n=1 Tax=Trichococcus palustris TaxID=140314 RepID=A0A143YZK8_9LACT|nr:flagellar motor switch flin/type iii secretion hrcqb [Trichococcus palustris]SFL13823.1 flagellar motor switch protein FliN [Trichococcus palustris]